MLITQGVFSSVLTITHSADKVLVFLFLFLQALVASIHYRRTSAAGGARSQSALCSGTPQSTAALLCFALLCFCLGHTLCHLGFFSNPFLSPIPLKEHFIVWVGFPQKPGLGLTHFDLFFLNLFLASPTKARRIFVVEIHYNRVYSKLKGFFL